jgi:hypothetical protein
MRTVIQSRFYKVRNITVEILLLRIESGSDLRYIVLEKLNGTKYQNEILRGVYNDSDVARIEFKNITNNLERTLPIKDFEMAY